MHIHLTIVSVNVSSGNPFGYRYVINHYYKKRFVCSNLVSFVVENSSIDWWPVMKNKTTVNGIGVLSAKESSQFDVAGIWLVKCIVYRTLLSMVKFMKCNNNFFNLLWVIQIFEKRYPELLKQLNTTFSIVPRKTRTLNHRIFMYWFIWTTSTAMRVIFKMLGTFPGGQIGATLWWYVLEFKCQLY